MIDALRVGAAFRRFHDMSDEHALKASFPGDEARSLTGVREKYFVDPTR